MRHNYHTAIITKVERETDKVKNFILDAYIAAKPGQYVMVWLPRIHEKPFGVVIDKPLTLSVANVGLVSKKIHELKRGDQLTFRGPYGSSFTIKEKKLLLVGGGYGVVPLYFLAAKLPAVKRKYVTVIIGAKNKNELPFTAKFRKLGCTVAVSTDDGSKGFRGYSTALAEKLLAAQHFDGIYTCGPEIMMKKVAQLAKNNKTFCQVSMERQFKCGGIGLCGECSFNGRIVCKEGPVFAGRVLLSK